MLFRSVCAGKSRERARERATKRERQTERGRERERERERDRKRERLFCAEALMRVFVCRRAGMWSENGRADRGTADCTLSGLLVCPYDHAHQ